MPWGCLHGVLLSYELACLQRCSDRQQRTRRSSAWVDPGLVTIAAADEEPMSPSPRALIEGYSLAKTWQNGIRGF